jgi:acyl-CoA thioester hydrolase
MYINEAKVKVRYAETDKMGVVYHSNYLIYFEIGRTEFINKCGMSYLQMEEMGIMIPLLESNCRYLQGAKYSDELIVKTWIEELDSLKVKFSYSITRESDRKEITKGNTLHVFVDNNFKIMNLKKKFPEIMLKLEGLL